MNHGNSNNFMQPRAYFAKGFFLGNDINPDLLLRPGPRLTQGLKEIYKRLYP